MDQYNSHLENLLLQKKYNLIQYREVQKKIQEDISSGNGELVDFRMREERRILSSLQALQKVINRFRENDMARAGVSENAQVRKVYAEVENIVQSAQDALEQTKQALGERKDDIQKELSSLNIPRRAKNPFDSPGPSMIDIST